MSELQHFSEHTLQEVALLFMGAVYVLRLRWLLRFQAGRERQAPTGNPGPAPRRRAILYSWANVAMPWAMESTRRQRLLYAQFVVFHLGVVAAIGLSFLIPYGPRLLESAPLRLLLHVLIGGACLVGLLRLRRRLGDLYLRAISTPDDVFSLLLLTVWFGWAFVAVPGGPLEGATASLVYFWLTAFFLVYVPFSKISHYLYYPFTRYYLGKTMGHRGVFPLRRVAGAAAGLLPAGERRS